MRHREARGRPEHSQKFWIAGKQGKWTALRQTETGGRKARDLAMDQARRDHSGVSAIAQGSVMREIFQAKICTGA